MSSGSSHCSQYSKQRLIHGFILHYSCLVFLDEYSQISSIVHSVSVGAYNIPLVNDQYELCQPVAHTVTRTTQAQFVIGIIAVLTGITSSVNSNHRELPLSCKYSSGLLLYKHLEIWPEMCSGFLLYLLCSDGFIY